MNRDTRPCVRCGGIFSAKSRFCPFCNMTHIRPFTKARTMCPQCNAALRPQEFRAHDIDVCPSCSGMWLDMYEFEYLTSQKDIYADRETPVHYDRLPLQNRPGYYECVRCEHLMYRINYRHISGILIDVCGDHGVWLDRDELARLRNFVAAGGIDRGQDYMLDCMRDDLGGLADRVGNIAFMQRTLHYWNSRRII